MRRPARDGGDAGWVAGHVLALVPACGGVTLGVSERGMKAPFDAFARRFSACSRGFKALFSFLLSGRGVGPRAVFALLRG